MWWLLATALASPEPSPETVVYYNARMALEEGDALESVKLWLLRNALANQSRYVSIHDPDFHSVTWAALGELGICMDGLPTDEDGGGIWPLAMHNWVVRNLGRKTRPKRPRPFDAFAVGRQQRFVSIDDVLAAKELDEVSLFRGRCALHRVLMAQSGEFPTADLADREVAAHLLLYLFDRADSTIVDERVRGRAVIEARRFDLYLQLAAIAARKARLEARARGREGRQGGLSKESVEVLLREAPQFAFSGDARPARILKECVDWPVSEWMSLSTDRRRFVFQQARAFGGDPAKLDAIALGVIDALIAEGEGEQVGLWIGLRTADPTTDPAAVWSGDRGSRLLSLDVEDGFGERGLVALHRGVSQLEQGDLPGALRSLAYALQRSQESASGEEVERLSRRWLSYVAGQFEITDSLLMTLRELVPVRDYAIILEDLMWRSALHADGVSFTRALDNQPSGGALERRMAMLAPLASGDVGRFSTQLRAGLETAPSETLRFVGQFLQRLELEDDEVRTSHLRTVTNLETALTARRAKSEGRTERSLDATIDRCRAIRDGIDGGSNPWDRMLGEARALSPDSEVFAGSLRLAPSDPLPWPFRAADTPPPPAFDPLELVPVMWLDEAGEAVFGWSLRG